MKRKNKNNVKKTISSKEGLFISSFIHSKPPPNILLKVICKVRINNHILHHHILPRCEVFFHSCNNVIHTWWNVECGMNVIGNNENIQNNQTKQTLSLNHYSISIALFGVLLGSPHKR